MQPRPFPPRVRRDPWHHHGSILASHQPSWGRTERAWACRACVLWPGRSATVSRVATRALQPSYKTRDNSQAVWLGRPKQLHENSYKTSPTTGPPTSFVGWRWRRHTRAILIVGSIPIVRHLALLNRVVDGGRWMSAAYSPLIRGDLRRLITNHTHILILIHHHHHLFLFLPKAITGRGCKSVSGRTQGSPGVTSARLTQKAVSRRGWALAFLSIWCLGKFHRLRRILGRVKEHGELPFSPPPRARLACVRSASRGATRPAVLHASET